MRDELVRKTRRITLHKDAARSLCFDVAQKSPTYRVAKPDSTCQMKLLHLDTRDTPTPNIQN